MFRQTELPPSTGELTRIYKQWINLPEVQSHEKFSELRALLPYIKRMEELDKNTVEQSIIEKELEKVIQSMRNTLRSLKGTQQFDASQDSKGDSVSDSTLRLRQVLTAVCSNPRGEAPASVMPEAEIDGIADDDSSQLNVNSLLAFPEKAHFIYWPTSSEAHQLEELANRLQQKSPTPQPSKPLHTISDCFFPEEDWRPRRDLALRTLSPNFRFFETLRNHLHQAKKAPTNNPIADDNNNQPTENPIDHGKHSTSINR